MNKSKKFDSIAWVRLVRDRNSNRLKKLSQKKFAERLAQEAKESKLWTRMAKRKAVKN